MRGSRCFTPFDAGGCGGQLEPTGTLRRLDPASAPGAQVPEESPAVPAGDRPRLRAHRPARRRADRRPLPRRQRARPAWIGRTDWVYQTTFDRPPPGDDRRRPGLRRARHGRHDHLNGVEVGRTANMHRGYRFDVDRVLRAGDNTLKVRFDSAYALRRGAARRARRPAQRVPRTVQLHPQDGLQLRLGLGTDPGHRRHLAARSACTPGRPPGSPRSARWSPSPAATAGSRCTSSSSGPAAAPVTRHRRGRRRHARGDVPAGQRTARAGPRRPRRRAVVAARVRRPAAYDWT